MVAARDRHLRKVLAEEGLVQREDETEEQRIRREDRAADLKSRMVALGSEQCHSSAQKAANILGLRYREVRAGGNTNYCMTGKALRARLEECRSRGLQPFFVAATIGTTVTCSIDKLDEIAEMKKEWPDLWLYIDAAYAGSALICEEYRGLTKAQYITEFDSFNVNLHKWLLLNFDARFVVPNFSPLTPTPSIC